MKMPLFLSTEKASIQLSIFILVMDSCNFVCSKAENRAERRDVDHKSGYSFPFFFCSGFTVFYIAS